MAGLEGNARDASSIIHLCRIALFLEIMTCEIPSKIDVNKHDICLYYINGIT